MYECMFHVVWSLEKQLRPGGLILVVAIWGTGNAFVSFVLLRQGPEFSFRHLLELELHHFSSALLEHRNISCQGGNEFGRSKMLRKRMKTVSPKWTSKRPEGRGVWHRRSKCEGGEDRPRLRFSTISVFRFRRFLFLSQKKRFFKTLSYDALFRKRSWKAFGRLGPRWRWISTTAARCCCWQCCVRFHVSCPPCFFWSLQGLSPLGRPLWGGQWWHIYSFLFNLSSIFSIYFIDVFNLVFMSQDLTLFSGCLLK